MGSPRCISSPPIARARLACASAIGSDVAMQPIHLFDGSGLSIETVSDLSQRFGPVDLSAQAWERVAASRAVVERQLASGAAIYGTNTGIGSQKDVAVADQELAEFSNRMIVSEAT